MKVNSKSKDYCIFRYDSKTGTFGPILESKLTKEQAIIKCGELRTGHMFSKTTVYNKLNQKQ